MIKFTDTSDEFTSTSIDGYKDIKTSKTISEKEVSDFWNDEFSKIQSEEKADYYGLSLLDLYFYDEDDINLDFAIDDKLKMLLDRFNGKVWDTLSDSERMSMLKEFADCIGEKLGLESVPKILLYDVGMNEGGRYDYETNKIELNKRYLYDIHETIDTVSHELRHAYQYMRANKLETPEDILFKLNFDNYVKPMFIEYWNQYIEVDARAFANMFTEAIK